MDPSIPATHSEVELAVLDAPVLARGWLTAFLLHVAEAGAFDPVWSEQIHANWARELQAAHPAIPAEHVRQRRLDLERSFPAAGTVASRDAQDEVLAHCTTAEDRRNAHVLATALSARAAVIVTLGPFGLKSVMTKLWHDTAVLTPDAWCLELLDRHPDSVLDGARSHRAASRQGELPVDAWLSALAGGMGLPRTAEALAGHRDRL